MEFNEDYSCESCKYYLAAGYILIVLAGFEYYYRCKYLPNMRAWARGTEVPL